MGTLKKKKFGPVTVNNNDQKIDDNAVKIDIENLPTPDENIEILGKNQEYSLTMYLDKNPDAKFLDRFIKATERLVRGNDDYRMWLESLRDIDFLSKDAFFPNITSSDAEIQLHHYPFNLYSICITECYRMLANGEKVSTFILADNVIRLHFKGIIGLIPLSVTMHQIAHLGRLKIIRKQIYGKWETYYNENKDYMSDYDHSIIKELLCRNVLTRDDSTIKELTYQDESIENDKDES